MLLKDAISACKKAFIPYLSAENYLKRRFVNLTREEVILWLNAGEVAAKSCPYANAENVQLANYLDSYGYSPSKHKQNMEDFLSTLYFSVDELKSVNPKRWIPFEKLKDWAGERGMDERMLMAIIKSDMLEYDYRMGDPTWRNEDEELGRAGEAKIRRAYYHPDWINALEEDYFHQSLIISSPVESNVAGGLEIEISNANHKQTSKAEGECRAWLISLMARPSKPKYAKAIYLAEARSKFPGVSDRGFNRAWGSAINETGNDHWSKPGRKSKQKS